MFIQPSLLDLLLIKVISVESLNISFHNIDNTDISKIHNLEIVATINKVLNSL